MEVRPPRMSPGPSDRYHSTLTTSDGWLRSCTGEKIATGRCSMAGFDGLGIAEPILRALDEMGYEEPSPVQVQAIPSMLQGRDIVVQALTGTGKTAAFGVPLVQQVDPRLVEPQGIVLAPTRELAVQVSEMITCIAQHRPIWVVP